MSKERFLILLISFLILGISVGVLQIKTQNTAILDKLSPYLQNISQTSELKNFLAIFWSEIKLILPLIIITFFCGFFAFGAPITVFVPFFYGIGYGASTAYGYLTYGASSICKSIITIAIPFAISGFFLILSCNESARMSSLLLRTVKGKISENDDFKSELKLFLFRQSFFLLFIIIVAIIKSAMILII
jgi:hypothetical protein